MPILDPTRAPPISREPPPDPFFSPQVIEARRFLLPRRSGVVGAGLEHVHPAYAVERPGLDFVAFELVTAGAGLALISGREYVLSSGCCLTYGPRIPHRITTDPRRRLVKYFVDLAPAHARRLFARLGLPIGAAWHISAAAGPARLLDELVREGTEPTPHSPTILDQIFSAVLLRCAAHRITAQPSGAAAIATYQRCLELIEDRALSLRTLAQLSSASGLDAAYLCRLFKRFGGRSPYQRLLRARMNHAAARLQSGDVLVKQVAAELGYRDPFHFSRVFRRVLGVSPQQFQRRS